MRNPGSGQSYQASECKEKEFSELGWGGLFQDRNELRWGGGWGGDRERERRRQISRILNLSSLSTAESGLSLRVSRFQSHSLPSPILPLSPPPPSSPSSFASGLCIIIR